MLNKIPNNMQIVIRALPKINEKDFLELENILETAILKSIEKANV
jgi:RNase P protein component